MSPRPFILLLASRLARGQALRSLALLSVVGNSLLALPAFAAAPIDAAVYKHTNKRIEALFHLRDEPLTFVNARNNPFRAPGTMSSSIVVAASDDVPEDVELTDADLLRLAVAPLKITGVMHVGNQIRLTINRSNYAVGDILQVKLNGETLDLRIVNIADKSVTFRLNETDFVLNF